MAGPEHTPQGAPGSTKRNPSKRPPRNPQQAPHDPKTEVKQMASIFGTLLSSQGSGAHRTQAFRLSFGATSKPYTTRPGRLKSAVFAPTRSAERAAEVRNRPDPGGCSRAHQERQDQPPAEGS
jgi:hypothetical protein